MQYTIKAGVLYKNESQTALKKRCIGWPTRRFYRISDNLLLTADALLLEKYASCIVNGD